MRYLEIRAPEIYGSTRIDFREAAIFSCKINRRLFGVFLARIKRERFAVSRKVGSIQDHPFSLSALPRNRGDSVRYRVDPSPAEIASSSIHSTAWPEKLRFEKQSNARSRKRLE